MLGYNTVVHAALLSFQMREHKINQIFLIFRRLIMFSWWLWKPGLNVLNLSRPIVLIFPLCLHRVLLIFRASTASVNCFKDASKQAQENIQNTLLQRENFY